jgi:hypothetical protein
MCLKQGRNDPRVEAMKGKQSSNVIVISGWEKRQ